MKTIKRMFNGLLMTIFISFSFTSQATEFSVSSVGDQAISIRIKKPYDGAVRLQLKDENGTIHHQESAYAHSIENRPIDLQFIPEGAYSLLIEYGQVIQVQPIQMSDNKIHVKSSELKTTFIPSIRHNGERLDLDMLFLGEFEVELSLTSQTGEIIYNSTKKHTGAYHKRLGLQGLGDGEYIFSIKIKSQQFAKEFSNEISWYGIASKN